MSVKTLVLPISPVVPRPQTPPATPTNRKDSNAYKVVIQNGSVVDGVKVRISLLVQYNCIVNCTYFLLMLSKLCFDLLHHCRNLHCSRKHFEQSGHSKMFS